MGVIIATFHSDSRSNGVAIGSRIGPEHWIFRGRVGDRHYEQYWEQAFHGADCILISFIRQPVD